MKKPNHDIDSEYTAGKYAQSDFIDFFNEYLSFQREIEELPTKIVKDKFQKKSESKFLNIAKHKSRGSQDSSCLFRKSTNSSDILINLWLSSVSRKSKLVVMANKFPEYKGLSKNDLTDLVKLSTDDEFIYKIPLILLEKGIIVIYEKSLEGMKLDGAVYKNEYGNPIIGLSFRFSRVDSFWFTLMHELSHIHLHYDKLENVIIDDITEIDSSDLVEMQANKLSRDSLISRSAWRGSSVRREHSKESIYKFATELKIDPAIVAGRVRFETENYSIFSDIINKLDLRKMVFKNG